MRINLHDPNTNLTLKKQEFQIGNISKLVSNQENISSNSS